MGVRKDALALGAYAVLGALGAAALIGTSLSGQSEESQVIVAYDQATSVSLSLDTLAAILPACEHEDTVPEDYACLWDASARGNNVGASFIVLSDGAVIYLAE